MQALSTQRGATRGHCNALVHCTHLPSSQYGVLPLQAGLQLAGASTVPASLLDGGASPCVPASDIVDDELAAPHQPPEQDWPSRQCSSDEHAIAGSLAQPAAPTSMVRRTARI